MRAEHELGRAVVHDERAVGKLVERGFVVTLRARAGLDALAVKLRVDRVRADLAGMQLRPDLREADIVLRRHSAQGRCPAANAVASSRKKSSVKRPGCSSGLRCQPRNSSRHAIQRLPL